MPSQALTVFQDLLADAENLLEHHPAEKGVAGRPAGDTGPLLRSTIVLIHTAWENYVEQSIIEAAPIMFAEIGEDWRRLPKPIRNALAESRNPWSLAGDQWKTAATVWVETKVAKLNTPNTENVVDLYKDCLGLENVLDATGWRGSGAAKNKAHIDEFVQDIRGEIVHKGTAPGPLRKNGVESWRDFFVRLTNKVESSVGEKFTKQWGVNPW